MESSESSNQYDLEQLYPPTLLELRDAYLESESQLQKYVKDESRSPLDSEWNTYVVKHLIAANQYLEARRDWLWWEYKYGKIESHTFAEELRSAKSQVTKNKTHIERLFLGLLERPAGLGIHQELKRELCAARL